jgi:hypothetical protein
VRSSQISVPHASCRSRRAKPVMLRIMEFFSAICDAT